MRKTDKKPSGGMSWRQFIMGPGRTDALERKARWELEEEEEKLRREQESKAQRSSQRVRKPEQQESSNRAEERNREDAERSARESNVKKQSAQQNETKTVNGKKTFMSDEEYRSTINLQLATGDNKNWWQKEAQEFRDDWAHHESDWWLAKPFNWFIKVGGGFLAKAFSDIGDDIARKENEKRDKERKEYLSQFTKQAYQDAKIRNLNLAAENMFNAGTYKQDDFMAGLNEEQQKSIANREQEYRNLIGPSQETVATHQQYLNDATQQLQGFANQSAPNRPDNYALRFTRDRYGRLNGVDFPWLNDFWTQAMENMNEVQRDEFAGMQTRFNERLFHADNASNYYAALQDQQRIPRWNALLDKYQRTPQLLTTWEQSTIQDLLGKDIADVTYADIEQKREQLKSREMEIPATLSRFKKDADFIESFDSSTSPVSYVHKHIQDFINRGFDWINPGWSANLADDVESLDIKLDGLKSASLDRKQQILQEYKEAGENKRESWQRGIEENEKDLQDWRDKHHVTDYFKFKMEHSDGSFYKPDTWLYKNANLWGSSQSSWIKQTTSLGLNTLIAATPVGSVAAGISQAGIGATSLGLGYSSSSDETNAEVAQNYRERLKSVLKSRKLTKEFLHNAPESVKSNIDDAVTEYTLRPWELGNRQAQEAVFDSLHGVNSLYQDGMAAVFGGEIAEMYLQISPFAAYARAAKPSSVLGHAAQAGARATTVSPTLGAAAFAGSAATRAASRSLSETAVGKALANQTKNFVNFSKKIPERLLGEAKYNKMLNMARKTNSNVFGANSVPHRVLSAEQYVKYQTLKDYGKDVASRTIGSSISEGIEEGKQYILGQKFIRGDYDNDVHKGLLDASRFYNDMQAGVQSAIAMSTLLPFMPALVKDADLIENIKGGMLGGMFQTGMQRAIFGIIPAAQQMRMQDFVANEIQLEKQAQLDDYQKAKVYARKASDNAAAGRMMLAFDRYAEAVQNQVNRGEGDITQDMVDQIKAQKKIAENVINLANSSDIIARANALGMKYGTDKFYQYVGAINMFQTSRTQAEERNNDAIAKSTETINSTRSPFKIDENGQVVSETVLNGGVKMQRAVKSITGAKGNPLSGQALLDASEENWKRNIRLFARIASLQSLRDYLSEAVTNDDIDSRTKKDLRFQLNRVNRLLRSELLNINDEHKEDVEKNAAQYLSHLENSEEILQAMHQEITSQIDLDYHDAMLKGLLGELTDFAGGTSDKLEDFVHSGYAHPESVVDDIENTVDSDYKLANDIEQDWLYQYDLLDDTVLDKKEQVRRKIRERKAALDAKKAQEDIQDQMLEEEDVVDDEDLINYAGSYTQNLTTEEPTVEEPPVTDPSQIFDVPLVDEEEQEIDNKKQISRFSQRQMSDIRKKAKNIRARGERAKRVGSNPTVIEPKKRKYQSPESILKNTPENVLDIFAGLEDLLQQFANIQEMDLIDVREETLWKVKDLEDRINMWMMNTLANQDFSSINLDEAEMFNIEAKAILDGLKIEIETSNSKINRARINFSDAKTLRRSTYTNEDIERARLKEEEKYEKDVRATFSILTNELYKIGNEIQSGLHIQNDDLDSPTATRIDEILATLDRLIDDAFEVGIIFEQKDIDTYTAAKRWFANKEGLTGRKSQPVPVQKPQPVMSTTTTAVVSYLNSSEYGNGVNQSTAEDGTKLSDVIGNPDFIQKGQFILSPIKQKQRASTVTKIAITVEYNGKKFSPIVLDSQMMNKTQSGKDFWAAVQKAYNTNAIGEDQILVPGRVFRTVGIQHHGGVFDNVLSKNLISIDRKDGVMNLYDVDFTRTQRTFGFTTAKQSSNNAYTTVVAAPDGTTLYTFNGDRNFEGALFMMLDRKYAETNPNKPARIPILLRAKKMSEGDAQLIADIFSGKYNPRGLSGRSALTETVYVDGENTGITGLDLIKVLIPQRGAKDLYSNRLHFDIDHVSGQLQIIGRIKGDDQSMEPKVRQFDMSTESGRAAFVEFAKTNIEVAIDKQFMMQRFGYNQHTLDFPFDKLFKAPAMIRRINAGEQIRFGNSCIAIDRTDIVNPNDENDQRGLSGLAWMMKNGLLETDFDGVTDINLGVDVEEGVKIIDRTPQNIDTTAGEQEQLSRAQAETGYTEEELAQFFDKAVSNLTAGRKINEVEVRKNLARILGVDFAYDSEKTQVIDAIIDTAADGFVIGRCYHDSIVLSTQAEAGTEYHEAFHRILEIVSPKRLRDAVYKAYRSNKEGAKSKSDAEIAELLADEFMYFAMNRPTFKLPHSIKEAFQMVKDYINFVKKIGSFRLYLMYSFTNSGLINKLFNVNKERQDTFKKLHSSGMNKVIHGKEFDKIINSAMYRDLKNSLIYLIFKSKVIDIAGRNIQELDISKEFIINSKMYEKWMEDENIPQSTKDAINQLLDNWELIKPDIAASISKFTTDAKVKVEEDNIDDANGDEESIAGAAIGDHTRSSYEFSQFSRATSRVKFFFSAIPNSKWIKVDGKSVPQYQLNKQGLPEFANPNILFNTILNKLHSCQTYQELLDGLEKLGYSDARIYHVYRRIKTIYDRVQNGQASAEEEGILTQIKTIIHSAKNEFLLASSKKLGDKYTIQMQSTDAEYNARQYIQDWQQLFESGVSAYITRGESGEYVMKNNYRPSIFGKISDEINAMAEAVTDPNVDHERIKFRVVKMLNSLGIQFDLGALDYMLRFKYGSSDAIGLQKMFSDPNFNITGLGNSLRILYDASGNLIQKNIRGLFDKIGFVRELANWKYEYRHAHDQLTVLAANDNRYYVISENNHITDQTDHLNRKDEYFDELCAFNYNLYEVGDAMQVGSKRTIGSLVLKYLSQDEYLNPIQVMTFAGFKTDEAGDAGQDYADINAREDYVAKASMLLQGAMVFPTMSDKKTWTFLTGVPMPGLKFERVRVNGQLQMVCNLNIAESGLIPQETVDQMWEYAMCERKAIAETLAIVRGGETENGTVPPLSDDKKVVNYHKATVEIKKKEYPIIQGARFSSLLGVWNDGKFIEFNRVLDENGKYLSEEDNLAIADQYFFDQPVNVQKNLIRQLLTNRVYDEIRKCERLGLVSKDGQGFYSNLGLDQMSVDAVMSAFIGNRTPTPADRSVAVCAVIADICCKHIISLQEVERLYSGHPAAYNWVYDEKGRLIDRSADQHKRLGGLVSTGTNNDLEINGIPDEYTCAEVDNDEPPAKNLEALSEQMCEGEIRASYIQSLLAEKNISFEDDELAKEIVKEADAKTLDEIRTEIGDKLYTVLKERGEKKAAAFKKVDVADGAAYISDKMAENLLRMVGSWNDQIATAFKVLRGEPVNGRVYTTKDIRELSSAYELVYTTVIGNQKYTAYGLRQSSGALVPYYDKMALFPMFKCMCTGKMADMYELMKQQGVDMVMVNSAVKTGSMGSKPITWGSDFKFNSYKQKYSQIRKQFNTDPKEAELMKVGTQSAKIAMSALIAGRTYTVNGQSQTSTEMREAIMEDQRKLSDLGLAEFEDEIFDVKRDEHGDVISKELNVEKFSEMLTEELTNRGASSELLDAVSIENGKMKMPLAALSGMSWIQSIIASIVNKRIVDIRIPGSAYIQRSAWGVEGSSIISDENIPPSLYGGKPLQMINENGSMDCVLSIDFFEHLIPKVVKRDEQGHIIYQVDDDGHFILDKEGNRKPVMERMSFEKARQWLLDNGIIGGEPTIFGYRIPTQAISSIHALRCVDVLPVVRDTVILPAEFTKITGADFDIDKLFLSTYFWQKKDGKMTTEFEEGTKEYYANDLIRRYMTLLTDLDENGKSRNTHVQHASIDGDTKLLTDVLQDLEEGIEKDPIAPYMDYTLAIHNSTKEEFIAGKFGIGPFALNNNSQILTTLYGVEFSPTTRGRINILGRLGLTSLHEYADRDGNQIMSWLSGLINANVDVAKDPYITRLGVNKYTYNLTNLLIRTGLGKTTLYMLTQPIMHRMSNAYSVASGTYMRTPGLTESQAQRNAINRVLLDEFKKLGIESDKDRPEDKVEDCIDKFKQHIYDTYKMSYMQAIEQLFAKDNDVLHDISKNGLFDESTNYYKVTVNDQDRKLTGLEVQLLVAIAKSQFDPYAQALADLVKYSKIDTAKQGKNIQEQREYLLGYHRIFDDESVAFSRTAFVAKGLNNMRDNSYVGVKTLNATSAFLSALEDQLIEATHSFASDCDFILSTIGKDDTQSKALLNTIAKKAAIKIKSNYFFGPGGFCEQFGIDPKSLVSGNNTIYDRLNKLRVMILSDPKYAELVDASGEINNYLLRSLTPSYTYTYNPRLNPAQGNRPDTYPTAKFIKLFNFTEEDTIDQDSIIEAWEELLNDGKFPELQEFARDLIVYSFMTAGDAGGMTDIFKYVPNSWKINPMGAGYESSYVFFIENELKQRKDSITGMFSMEDVQDILQNCWYNDDIITTLYSIPKTIDQITLASQSHPQILIPKNSIFLPYMFKVPREKASDKFSQRHYSMYKMVEINGKIVYVEVDPKGMKFPFGHYIYEMSRQDNQYSDAIVSLLLDPNMSALAKQFGLSTDSIQSFLNDLVEKLNEQPQLGPALVEGNVLSKNISELSNARTADNVAPDTRPVPQDQEPQAEINIYAGDNENADLSNFAERPLNFGKVTAYSLPEGATSGAFTSKYSIYDIGKVTYSTKENPNSGDSFVFDGLSDLFSGRRFKTVEGAFQAAKIAFTHPKGNGAKGNKYWQPKEYTQRENSMDGVYYNTADVFVLTDEGKQLLQKFQEASGAQARSLGRQIEGLDRQEWDANSSRIMKALIGRSFEANPQALQRLLATGNATLTHTQDKGKWGTEFPRLLMEVRDELRGTTAPMGLTTSQNEPSSPSTKQIQSDVKPTTVGFDENSGNGAEFSPGNIEDAVAKSLTSKQDDTVQEPDENGVIQGKLGVDKSQLIALLGNTMYTASVQDVAEKELVQNAFDATKIAIAQGQIKKGKITVELDSKQRTVTITDNGSGMTPEIVQKAFFTIGGSYKGENTDNRLKSGGLGLAKMAFLFTADYVELTTVKDGKKVYVKATPQQIQNDDFKIIVSSTNEPNGTSVSVKVPETYLDQEGNERSIWFSTYGDGFFSNPMIGNVEVTRIVDGKERWTRDFNKIPEGYTMIGTATSDFGDIEIYKDFSHETSDYKVLISGLYQFYGWVNGEGTHYATIINILPSVGTKSEVYPINNQREGFRSTINPEIEDLEYFLKKLDGLFERKKLKTSFGSSFNMDSESLENIEQKSDVTTEDLIKEVLNDIKQQYKPISTKTSNQDDDSENFGIELNTLTEERKESEKKRRSSFDTSSIPIEEQNQYVDTSNLDLQKAVFYNNTTFKPSKNTIEFLTQFGSMIIQLRNSFLALQSNNLHYKAVAENMKTQYWGVAIDKDYNGVNVSPNLFNFLGLNPISMANMTLKEGIVENFEYVLEELLFHNILHEINHNAVGRHNESFTIQFQYTYSEFAKIGEGLYNWRKQLRNLIKQYLKDIIEDAKKYDQSTNVGESLEGRSQRIKTQKSSQSSVENNEQAIYGSGDIGILSDAIKHFVNNKLGRGSVLLQQLKSLGAELMDKCKG